MKQLFLTISILTLLITYQTSALGASNWAFYYDKIQQPNSVQQTADGGCIVLGMIPGAGPPGYDLDVWVARFDVAGNIVWSKTFGTARYDYCRAIKDTSDGGFIIAGYLNFAGSYGFDISLLKLDTNGNILWQKSYGSELHNLWGPDDDVVNAIQQTADGGYIVAGYSTNYEWNYPGAWVLKLDTNGNISWQKIFREGALLSSTATDIWQTADGGYIVTGYSGPYGAGASGLIFKLDNNGNLQWEKKYNISGSPTTIRETADHDYIVAGYTNKYNYFDPWVWKLDNNGNTIWQKAYVMGGYEEATSIHTTLDGDYIVAIAASRLMKIDEDGRVLWIKDYSGGFIPYADTGSSDLLDQTADGDFIFASTGLIPPSANGLFLLKLNNAGDIPNCDLNQIVDYTETEMDFIGADFNLTGTPKYRVVVKEGR